MPNTGKYHLYIHADDIERKTDPVAGGRSAMSKEDRKDARFEKALTGLVAYPSVKGTADKIINFKIGQVSLSTGAVEYEQRLQASYNMASSLADTVYSSVISASVGGFPLAALNLAMKAVTSLFDVLQKYNRIQLQKSIENVSIDMSVFRAGNRRGNG